MTARVGRWQVWLATPGGAAEAARWCAQVEQVARPGAGVHRSKHADTYRVQGADGDCYVKMYRRYRRVTALKDLLRPSKARHARRMSRRLAAAGFAVPGVLAVGEDRCGAVVRRAWIVTAALQGEPVQTRVAALAGARERKRALLAAVGREVARLHDAGFVAGDLVAPNVWVVGDATGERIAFLDHDRTAGGRGPAWWWRARRNLVQLNRLVVPGVSTTDRLRVYRAYARARGWPWPVARRRMIWIVAKTIARRRRFDGVATGAHVSFRELMRADGPYAPGAPERPAPAAGSGSLPAAAPAYEARHLYQDPAYAAAYDEHRFGRHPKKRERDLRTRRAVLRALVRLGDGGHVLDLPCGTGRMTQMLLDAGRRYVGLDISDAMLALARRRYRDEPRAAFLKADAECLPFADDAVDCVVCVRFLHLLPSDVRLRMLRELARVARQHLVIDVRFFRGHEGWQRLVGWCVPRIGERMRRRDQLKRELAEAGWEERFWLRYKSRGWLSSTRMVGAYAKAAAPGRARTTIRLSVGPP